MINGPNINMLGIREKNIYGSRSYSDLINFLEQKAKDLNLELEFFQSNSEGAIVDRIQKLYNSDISWILINPAAYSHTSIAILDALLAINIPFVEFRHFSYYSKYAMATFKGEGFDSYLKALKFIRGES